MQEPTGSLTVYPFSRLTSYPTRDNHPHRFVFITSQPSISWGQRFFAITKINQYPMSDDENTMEWKDPSRTSPERSGSHDGRALRKRPLGSPIVTSFPQFSMFPAELRFAVWEYFALPKGPMLRKLMFICSSFPSKKSTTSITISCLIHDIRSYLEAMC